MRAQPCPYLVSLPCRLATGGSALAAAAKIRRSGRLPGAAVVFLDWRRKYLPTRRPSNTSTLLKLLIIQGMFGPYMTIAGRTLTQSRPRPRPACGLPASIRSLVQPVLLPERPWYSSPAAAVEPAACDPALGVEREHTRRPDHEVIDDGMLPGMVARVQRHITGGPEHLQPAPGVALGRGHPDRGGYDRGRPGSVDDVGGSEDRCGRQPISPVLPDAEGQPTTMRG